MFLVKSSIRVSAASAVVALATSALLAESVKTPLQHTPFTTALLRNFDTWDTNHDGTLSVDEINAAVVDPKIKGEDAAAAASLKLLTRSKKDKMPALTKEFFADYDKHAVALMEHRKEPAPADAANATVDTVSSGATTQPAARSAKLPADFDLYFAASKDRIARGGAVPYTGRFDLTHTRQGPLGDCFLVSSVSTLVYHDPDRAAKLITPQKDGSYVVQLPTTRPIEVPALTDAELAISSTTAGDGEWLAIMEQAFGKYRALSKGESDDVEGTELIRTGGDSMPTLHALTGHKIVRFAFGKTVEEHTANAEKMLPKLREELVSALADHRAITAGVAGRKAATTEETIKETAALPKLPPDINSNHVYAVLSYDKATDIVEIWNPHGQHFEPKGPAGLEHGYPTEHGRFKLPLTEAFAFYSSFTFETAEK
jgi:hypothetical protein